MGRHYRNVAGDSLGNLQFIQLSICAFLMVGRGQTCLEADLFWTLLQHYSWKLIYVGHGYSTGCFSNSLCCYHYRGSSQWQFWKTYIAGDTTLIFCVAALLYEVICVMARSVENRTFWNVLCEVKLHISTCPEHHSRSRLGIHWKLWSMYISTAVEYKGPQHMLLQVFCVFWNIKAVSIWTLW